MAQPYPDSHLAYVLRRSKSSSYRKSSGGSTIPKYHVLCTWRGSCVWRILESQPVQGVSSLNGVLVEQCLAFSLTGLRNTYNDSHALHRSPSHIQPPSRALSAPSSSLSWLGPPFPCFPSCAHTPSHVSQPESPRLFCVCFVRPRHRSSPGK